MFGTACKIKDSWFSLKITLSFQSRVNMVGKGVQLAKTAWMTAMNRKRIHSCCSLLCTSQTGEIHRSSCVKVRLRFQATRPYFKASLVLYFPVFVQTVSCRGVRTTLIPMISLHQPCYAVKAVLYLRESNDGLLARGWRNKQLKQTIQVLKGLFTTGNLLQIFLSITIKSRLGKVRVAL